jgi:hypothetical protein
VFMMLMDGIAWLVVIGLGVLVFIFVSAGLGSLVGRVLRPIYLLLRTKKQKEHDEWLHQFLRNTKPRQPQ